jgi:hypothetical protein
MRKILIKMFIFTSLILLLSSSCERCHERWSNALIIKFNDSNTKKNIFHDENYNIDSVILYNISDSIYPHFVWSNDTSLMLSAENVFYPDNNFNKVSTKEFSIYFNKFDVDTFKCEVKVNEGDECYYLGIEYAEIYCYDTAYIFKESENSVHNFKVTVIKP